MKSKKNRKRVIRLGLMIMGGQLPPTTVLVFAYPLSIL